MLLQYSVSIPATIIFTTAPTSSPIDVAAVIRQEIVVRRSDTNNNKQPEQSSRGKYNICPHINTFIRNTSRVEEALDQVHHFHNRGGALQSIMAYQDKNMKRIFAEHNLTFDQKDSGRMLYGTEAHDFIKDFMATSSNPRGGYFSSLPGHYPNSSLINSHHIDFDDKKVRTVQEPNSEERWIAGMGPIGPECDDLIELGVGFESKVGIS